MTVIASELDAKLQSVDSETARRLVRLVRDAMELAQTASTADRFDQLAGEEAELRMRLIQAGRRFSARERLSRDAAHDRDAFR
jgi:hypothetical protein